MQYTNIEKLQYVPDVVKRILSFEQGKVVIVHDNGFSMFQKSVGGKGKVSFDMSKSEYAKILAHFSGIVFAKVLTKETEKEFLDAVDLLCKKSIAVSAVNTNSRVLKGVRFERGIVAQNLDVKIDLCNVAFVTSLSAFVKLSESEYGIVYNVTDADKVKAKHKVLELRNVNSDAKFELMNNLVYGNKVLEKRLKFRGVLFDVSLSDFIQMKRFDDIVGESKARNLILKDVSTSNGVMLMSAYEMRHGFVSKGRVIVA